MVTKTITKLLDDDEHNIYYCRQTDYKKKMRTLHKTKTKKGIVTRVTFRKRMNILQQCMTRMKIVPANTSNGKYCAVTMYCPIHNHRLVLGY